MGKTKKYDFVAVDCEKASNEASSLCSIGIACFKNGRVKLEKEYIIKPYPFMFYNGSVVDNCYHDVPISVYEKAPTIKDIWPKIRHYFFDYIVVGHGIMGDFQTIQLALKHYGIDEKFPEQDECICTNIASIYTYPEFESHKLKSLCENLEIDVNPHHALSDAKASGLLFLNMLNVTDCKTASDFIKICIKYREIITDKYTDKNIEKYEEKIKDMFNYKEDEIKLIFKNRNNFEINVIDFYKKQTLYNLPFLRVVNCISPIIEVYKNKKYELYIDELNKLNPFSHDTFLYLKTGEEEYTLFFGLLSDKTDLIFELTMFLSKISIPLESDNFIEISFKELLRYRNGINIMLKYLIEKEELNRDDVKQYIEFKYAQIAEYFNGYDFRKQYESMIKNEVSAQSFNIFKNNLIYLAKLIGVYIAIDENFPENELTVPNCYNGTFSLFKEISDIINLNCSLDEYIYIVQKWYRENIEPMDIYF